MAATRRITANFTRAEAVHEKAACGVALYFTPTSRGARDVGGVEDYADLGPELTLASSHGLGTLLRLMRATRVAAPKPAQSMLGEPTATAAKLAPGVGHAVALEIVPRNRILFRAWTEEDAIEIDNVVEVLSDETAYLIARVGHRMPVRILRSSVVRHETVREPWFQIVGIERA